jgi:hypothetical protein
MDAAESVNFVDLHTKSSLDPSLANSPSVKDRIAAMKQMERLKAMKQVQEKISTQQSVIKALSVDREGQPVSPSRRLGLEPEPEPEFQQRQRILTGYEHAPLAEEGEVESPGRRDAREGVDARFAKQHAALAAKALRKDPTRAAAQAGDGAATEAAVQPLGPAPEPPPEPALEEPAVHLHSMESEAVPETAPEPEPEPEALADDDADFLLVVCPEGVGAGDAIIVAGPDGEFEVEVPEGVEAGDEFEVFVGQLDSGSGTDLANGSAKDLGPSEPANTTTDQAVQLEAYDPGAILVAAISDEASPQVDEPEIGGEAEPPGPVSGSVAAQQADELSATAEAERKTEVRASPDAVDDPVYGMLASLLGEGGAGDDHLQPSSEDELEAVGGSLLDELDTGDNAAPEQLGGVMSEQAARAFSAA